MTKFDTLYKQLLKENADLNKTSIPSEVFNNSYCIFVAADHKDTFKSAITEHGYDKEGIRVLTADFDNHTAVIVIPAKSNIREIEDSLHKLPASKDGFWGQSGMGYKGKSWSEV